MPKLLKKTKNSLAKTVKGYSNKLDERAYTQLNQLFIDYGRCRSMFFNEYCGIRHLDQLSFRKLRNQIRKKHKNLYAKRYHFLGRHWVYALFDSCGNIQSMWSNLANRLRKVIQGNSNIDEDEQHFLYYCLCFPSLWQGILLYTFERGLPKKYQIQYRVLKDKLTIKQFKHACSYLRRITRRYKAYPYKNNHHNRSITYDENMYRFSKGYFRFSSNKAHQVFKVKLTSSWHYKQTGNLQIILDRSKKRIEIHKLIQTHTKSINNKPNVLGIDKGLHNLISCSSDHEYGLNFSNLTYSEVERLAKYNTERNKYFNQGQKIGSKTYHKRHNKFKAHLISIINQAIYQMIKQEKPTLIIKEDLTFTKEKLPKTKNKNLAKMRRQLSSWTKGVLDKRIEYLANKYNIQTKDINPAYTSQYCPTCGRHFLERTGKHKEIAICPKCSQVNCNTAAAKNIKNRYYDKEITSYTPYKKVKAILDSRIS